MPNSRDDWKRYLSAINNATAEYPFGPEVVVYKIGGKMFALLSEDDKPPRMTLKGDPERCEEWRLIYPQAVTAGYHMNKRYWNTVLLNGTVPDDEVQEMVQHSYSQVISSLPKSVRSELTKSAASESE